MELHLTKKDFVIEWFSGSGGGGQHRNKHANCCRISHTPPDGRVLRVQSTKHKDRPSNQRDAFNRLARMVVAHYMWLDEHPASATRSDERVRTYHEPRNTVQDHASGLEQPYKKVVGNGRIGDMIEARHKATTSLSDQVTK